MNNIEIFLIIIVTVWTIAFIIFCSALIFIIVKVKSSIDRINQMVEKAESVTGEVGSSLRNVATGLAAIATKNLVTSVAKKILKLRSKRA